ncbi:MAG: sensor histidine kinase [Acidobacteriota bacterium]
MTSLWSNLPDTRNTRAALGALLGMILAAPVQLFAALPAIRELTRPLDDAPRTLVLQSTPIQRFRGAENKVRLVIWPTQTEDSAGINSERGRADVAALIQRLFAYGATGVGVYLPLNPYLNFSELASISPEDLSQSPRLDWLAEARSLDRVILQLSPANPAIKPGGVRTIEDIAQLTGKETPALQSSLRGNIGSPLGQTGLLTLRFERSAVDGWSMSAISGFDGLRRLASLRDISAGRRLEEWTHGDVWLNLPPHQENLWESYPADAVLQGNTVPERFRDALVLIITQESLSFAQAVNTPSGSYCAPHLLAAALTMALGNAASVPLGGELNLILLILNGVIVGVVSCIYGYKPASFVVLLLLVASFMTVLVGAWGFNVWVAPLPLVLCIALTWWAGTVWHARLDAAASIRLQHDRLKILTEELQATQRSLLDYEESERRELASEIHDQTLSDLRQLTQIVSKLKYEPLEPVVSELHERLDRTADEARRIVNRLRPSLLDNIGLLSACHAHLREMAKLPTQSFTYKFHCEVEEDELILSSEEKIALYRIVQESINNISKHAQAMQVLLTIRQQASRLIIEIEDDGCGFDFAAPHRKGHGLVGMNARARSIGATLEWQRPSSGKGTLVILSFPMSGKDIL